MRFSALSSLFLAASVACGCQPGSPANNGSPDAGGTELARPRAEPIEYVGLSVTRPVANVTELLGYLEPLFGAQARAGQLHTNRELSTGVFLTTQQDTRTPEQVVVLVDMELSRGAPTARRQILRVPASFEYGGIYIEAVKVALARAATVEGQRAGSMEPFFLQYRSTSVNGGDLSVITRFENSRITLEFKTNAARTSLQPGRTNTGAFRGDPYETLAGTVWFSLSRDEFGFFSTRAYGVTSGAAQNFRDFQLLPHDWLRLTVTPRLADGLVDVGFEVVAQDGRRIQVAKAPASFVAGEQFQQNVFRMVDNMVAQERAQAGSSTPFEVPYYYDDPSGGGVVQVIATGVNGRFKIAYAVESPVKYLQDVQYLAYQGRVDIPTTPPPVAQTCEQRGSTTALRGRFKVRFDASTTVRQSPDLTLPLRGNVWFSVYRSADVTIGGPRDGAQSVASFSFQNVDITAGPSAMTYDIPDELPVGDYQILGFLDVDGNSPPSGDASVGDPVTLPIGGYKIECAENPITIEFALLLPAGY